MTPDYGRLSPLEAWQTILQTLFHLGCQNLQTADLQKGEPNNRSDHSQVIQNYVWGPDSINPAYLRDVVSCVLSSFLHFWQYTGFQNAWRPSERLQTKDCILHCILAPSNERLLLPFEEEVVIVEQAETHPACLQKGSGHSTLSIGLDKVSLVLTDFSTIPSPEKIGPSPKHPSPRTCTLCSPQLILERLEEGRDPAALLRQTRRIGVLLFRPPRTSQFLRLPIRLRKSPQRHPGLAPKTTSLSLRKPMMPASQTAYWPSTSHWRLLSQEQLPKMSFIHQHSCLYSP